MTQYDRARPRLPVRAGTRTGPACRAPGGRDGDLRLNLQACPCSRWTRTTSRGAVPGGHRPADRDPPVRRPECTACCPASRRRPRGEHADPRPGHRRRRDLRGRDPDPGRAGAEDPPRSTSPGRRRQPADRVFLVGRSMKTFDACVSGTCRQRDRARPVPGLRRHPARAAPALHAAQPA